MITLKPRLRAVADMVRNGSILADIGTDHAYLPAFLLSEGVIPHALVADVNKGPLDNAQATVSHYGLSDKTELFLSDGLKSVPVERADDIVIAGMGGILISGILDACPQIKDPSKKLILQPQSHSEDLRKWLFSNGFEITEEKACFEDGKVYICMSAVFTGKAVCKAEADLIFGPFAGKTDPASLAFVEKKLRPLKMRYKALTSARPDDPSLPGLSGIIEKAEACLNDNR